MASELDLIAAGMQQATNNFGKNQWSFGLNMPWSGGLVRIKLYHGSPLANEPELFQVAFFQMG